MCIRDRYNVVWAPISLPTFLDILNPCLQLWTDWTGWSQWIAHCVQNWHSVISKLSSFLKKDFGFQICNMLHCDPLNALQWVVGWPLSVAPYSSQTSWNSAVKSPKQLVRPLLFHEGGNYSLFLLIVLSLNTLFLSICMARYSNSLLQKKYEIELGAIESTIMFIIT